MLIPPVEAYEERYGQGVWSNVTALPPEFIPANPNILPNVRGINSGYEQSYDMDNVITH